MLKLALICTITGIFFLYLISENVKLEEKQIFEAKQMQEGKVRIKGFVENVEQKEGLTIITVSKKESIEVIVFENIDFEIGTQVDVTGEIEEYSGKKEIIAEEII